MKAIKKKKTQILIQPILFFLALPSLVAEIATREEIAEAPAKSTPLHRCHSTFASVPLGPARAKFPPLSETTRARANSVGKKNPVSITLLSRAELHSFALIT